MDELVSWFTRYGGAIDTTKMGLTDFPGQGRGAIALQDIPKDHVLFSLPRSLTLSLRTSKLPQLFGQAAWKKFSLDKGWVGLILCMMWEEAQGERSKWAGYLKNLPNDFDTPMFWTEEELKELEGTSIADKIGREDAERDYIEKLMPAIQSRPDLFVPTHITTHYYSLANYHLMGSRILSRSFHVERAEGEEVDNDEVVGGVPVGDVSFESQRSAMSVDGEDVEGQGDESDSEDEDEEDPADVAMVPMADMLNARYGSENAKLFYEQVELKMVTTKSIKAGEQIYNTYGNPPNSDLLRRYGHVDLLPLSEGESESGGDGDGDGDEKMKMKGNPADVVDINADLVSEVVASITQKGVDVDDSEWNLKERIEWWLEEGGDDMFTLEATSDLPDGLVSFTKLLLCSDEEWYKLHDKGKPPKPKLDTQVLGPLISVIEKRLEKYPTTLEEDLTLYTLTGPSTAQPPPPLSRKSKALIVRIGEKRILTSLLTTLRGRLASPSDENGNGKKRKDGPGVRGRDRDREGEPGRGGGKRTRV